MSRRGMTLLEVLIASAILVVVVTIAVMLMLEGVMFSRRGQELADTNEAAHLAGSAIAAALQRAGMGMGNGLLVAQGGSAQRTNPVIVVNRTDGPDELWVVRPHRNALLESCVEEGAATTVQRTGFGSISARCAIAGWKGKALSGQGAGLLLAVTNLKQAVLLTGAEFDDFGTGSGVNLTFKEQGVSGFGTDEVSGFRQGDLIMPVALERYFIADDGRDAGVTALFVQPGAVGDTRYPVPAGAPRLVQEGIEDLQFALGGDETGSGNPDDIRWTNDGSLPAQPFRPGVKSVRVSVVARSERTILSSDGRVQQSTQYAPMSIEDHVVAGGDGGVPAPDGYRRTLYSRRVELLNLSAGDL